MIRYDLQCKKGHRFDGWFASGAAYDKLVKKKLVACTRCGATEVEKALMAPAIGGTRQNKQAGSPPPPKRRRTRNEAPEPAPQTMAAELPAEHKQLLEAMRKLRQEVEAKAEYVGPKFADEARKIHYDEAPARGIYGEATPDEAKALHDEGVAVYPLPLLPEDKN